MSTLLVEQSELGKKSEYDTTYNPDKLFPISRKANREAINIDPNQLPFYGFDLWNHYEVSWLDAKGKPVVGVAQISYDCNSPQLIESKSMKLYFNSFNNTKFNSIDDLKTTIVNDLKSRIDSDVDVIVTPSKNFKDELIYSKLDGICVDHLDVACSTYNVDPSLLCTEDKMVEETLYSDLLKSNCLVTKQPDWGSVQIHYKGNQIGHAGLLKYIVSFRDHIGFHEQCIEQIFIDILRHCKPTELTVYGRYTRRGGLDINPLRSTRKVAWSDLNKRLYRQ